MSPLFSIITVTYNAAKALGRTLQSVGGQTYGEIEYVVIDGGSTDGTMEQVAMWKVQEVDERKQRGMEPMRCVIVSEPDRGLYDAMNKGLKRATGNYVWFLNAGDTFKSPETVARLAKLAEQNGMPDILYGETDVTDSEGRFIAARRLKAPEMLTWRSFRTGMRVCHQAFVVKRSVAPMYDLQYRFSADFDWCIRCMKQAQRIVNSRMRLVNYEAEGMTTRNRKASLAERYRIMCHYYGTLPTLGRHMWFAARFLWAKVSGNKA